MNTAIFLTENFGTISAVLCVLIIVFIFLSRQNNGLHTARYNYWNKNLPSGFKGFKIVQISDYHNKASLENKTVRLTEYEKPDIIAVTGDLFDCRKTDIAAGLSLAKRLVKIAPVYYVSGNHEARIENIDKVKKELVKIGVEILDDRKVTLQRNGAFITLMGVADPRFYTKDFMDDADKKAFRNHLLRTNSADNTFKLLLSHRPEFIHTYRDSKIDLALTGHAHGGQFGIPFTDIGVFVPNQGLFPPFAAGMKQLDGTTEIISRGIGNSLFPFRLFNLPEVVSIVFDE